MSGLAAQLKPQYKKTPSSNSTLGLDHPVSFEGTVSSCIDEIPPTLTVSKLDFFHYFKAVFEISTFLFSNLSVTETLPACSSMKSCCSNDQLSEQLLIGGSFITSKLRYNVQCIQTNY